MSADDRSRIRSRSSSESGITRWSRVQRNWLSDNGLKRSSARNKQGQRTHFSRIEYIVDNAVQPGGQLSSVRASAAQRLCVSWESAEGSLTACLLPPVPDPLGYAVSGLGEAGFLQTRRSLVARARVWRAPRRHGAALVVQLGGLPAARLLNRTTEEWRAV